MRLLYSTWLRTTPHSVSFTLINARDGGHMVRKECHLTRSDICYSILQDDKVTLVILAVSVKVIHIFPYFIKMKVIF